MTRSLEKPTPNTQEAIPGIPTPREGSDRLTGEKDRVNILGSGAVRRTIFTDGIPKELQLPDNPTVQLGDQ